MIDGKKYTCKLYTLDGELDAIANLLPSDRVRVAAVNGAFSIITSRSIAERKFWNDDNPTFYAC